MSRLSQFSWRKELLVFLAASVFAAGEGARAQETSPQVQSQAPGQKQPSRRMTAPSDVPSAPTPLFSDLNNENFDHVAATAAQVKQVLIGDPGIMVELKRWVAKEASDNGQIINDADLSDQAIYDRLELDVKFRAVATRLVQRYGYLKPQINPFSDDAKQQELILKERARKLVEVEIQQEAAQAEELKEARKAQRQAANSPYNCRESALGLVDSEASQEIYDGIPDCRDLERSLNRGSGYGYPQNGNSNPDFYGPQNLPLQPSVPQQGFPGYSNSPILRTQTNGYPQSVGMSDNSLSLQNISASSSSRGMAAGTMSDAFAGGSGMPGVESASLGSNTGFAGSYGAFGENNYWGTDTYPVTGNPRSELSQPSLLRRNYRPKEPYIAPESVVHRPSPYADIPSLYDLYVQAPSRIGKVQRFGSEVFRDGLRDPRAVPMDLPVGPDYVVGPGDSLSVDLWGGVTTRLVRAVDRQGRVSLPEAGPVEVSGKSLGEVQQLVQKAVASQFRDTSADVSVSRLRTVRIYVVGEVSEPGAYDISSLSTPLNAIVSANGVTPRGSLRVLKHYRGKELLESVDAYDLLLRGVTPDAKKLESGDTLMVPPIGPQVTVTGMVRRPSVYELRDEKTLADVLGLAGGILPAATLKHIEVQRLEAHEKRTMLSLDLSDDTADAPQLSTFNVKDGDEIHIFPIAPYNQDAIYLQGHVLRPGRYSYREGMKITDLITSYKDMLPEPAPHYGEIVRLNPPDFHPSVESFDLAAALTNPSAAPKLEPLDTVRVFSRFDFEPAPTVWVGGEVRSPGKYNTSGQVHLRDAVYLAGGVTRDADLSNAQLFRIEPDGSSKILSVNLQSALGGNPIDNILLTPRDRLLIHRNIQQIDPATVDVKGEVAKPGRYAFTSNMRVQDLIQAAGGLKRSADTTTADLTRYGLNGRSGEHLEVSLASVMNGNATEDIPIHSGDVLSIRQVPGWKDIGASVTIRGEVQHPGTFGIQPGEKLSSVLRRAGGYNSQAYPYGALLMRSEVREQQQSAHAELVRRVQTLQASLQAMPEDNQSQKQAKLTAMNQSETTLEQLRLSQPVGRVVIHIQDPIEKWKNTPSDVVLREGDVLVIPKKANYVMVNGQVYNPTAVSYRPGRSGRWYLSQSGGLTPLADKKGVFVIRADGSVISSKSGEEWWSGNPLSAALRPGDTVVVPERAPQLARRDYAQLLQYAQVASSIALAITYIHP